MLFLEQANAHSRDSRIKFFEKGHKYEIDGEGGYTSVTTFNHNQFEKFNPGLTKSVPNNKHYHLRYILQRFS